MVVSTKRKVTIWVLRFAPITPQQAVLNYYTSQCILSYVNPLMPVGNYSCQFFICFPRDCVSRHNGGTSGAPLKPLRVDSALRALSTLRGLRGAPEMPPLCQETQSLGQQMWNAPFGINGLTLLHARRRENNILYSRQRQTNK